MSTGAEAQNSTSASAYTNPYGTGADTNAYTSGHTRSYSDGYTYGNAFGAAGSSALQHGDASASALDVGFFRLASAGSEAEVSSMSLTGVINNGWANAHTYTSAGNSSSASVSGCGWCNQNTAASTGGHAYSNTPDYWGGYYYNGGYYYGDNGAWGNAISLSGGTANADGYGIAIGGLKTSIAR
jgi:hypothetical protein